MVAYRLRLCLSALLLTAALWPADAAAPDSLQLVHVLYRHGARTPIDGYPTDPNTGAWPQGPGQLTNEGKRNQLGLGRFLRKRYDGFLPAHYHMNYTRVRSTDVDRTLMSAQVNLAGLFPPQGEDVWDASLAWQPIPVHTVPLTEEFLLRSFYTCEAYVAERKRVDSSDGIAAINRQHQTLYDYLSEHSGYEVDNLARLSDLYDVLLVEWRANLTTPDWALATLPGYSAPVFPDTMAPLNDLEFGLYGATELQRRLGGGPLLKEIITQMRARADSSLQPPERRMFMYSAHDTTVACLTTALQVYNGLAPPLASCVLVELHSDPAEAGGHFVQLWYRNDSSVEPYALQLPGCDVNCPLEQFVDLTKNVVPEDLAEECKV